MASRDNESESPRTAPLSRETAIAGHVSIAELMTGLAKQRPVFHSEADFQHAFARALWEAAPDVQSRLEVPNRSSSGSEHLDLLCIGANARTAIEFKYWTRSWTGTAGTPTEEYRLKAHAATDIARRNFVFDIARLERFGEQTRQNGIALILTNESSLWAAPPQRAAKTRDSAFRIHEGSTLAGTLLWGGGDYPANTRELHGKYDLAWTDYSSQSGAGGTFRYLIVETLPTLD
ncbi:MAG: hypothetical protein ACOH2F_03810 [Cellulomonas sp.]